MISSISTEEFSTLCTVRADLSPLKGSAQPQTGKNGNTYWKIVFTVEIHFGLTEFRARIKWVDNVRLALLHLQFTKICTMQGEVK
jgi:hypothetical protein